MASMFSDLEREIESITREVRGRVIDVHSMPFIVYSEEQNPMMYKENSALLELATQLTRAGLPPVSTIPVLELVLESGHDIGRIIFFGEVPSIVKNETIIAYVPKGNHMKPDVKTEVAYMIKTLDAGLTMTGGVQAATYIADAGYLRTVLNKK